MNNSTPQRADLIIRTSKRKEEGKSPEQQKQIAESWIQTWGDNRYEIVKIHDSGKSESGKTMDRKSVRDVLARMKRGQTDALMVAFLDRFGRASIQEAMEVVAEIQKYGGVLIAADGGGVIRSAEPQDETNLVMQLQFARQQWRQIQNRFALSQRNALEKGLWVGKPPFGYIHTSHSPLLPDPDCSHLVPELFERWDDGVTFNELWQWLGGVWKGRLPNFSRFFHNRTYLGETHRGSFHRVDTHEPLVSHELYESVQRAREHGNVRGGQYSKSDRLFARQKLLKCACGSNMTVNTQRMRNGEPYYSYYCGGLDLDGNHKKLAIGSKIVEEYVLEAAARKLEGAKGHGSRAQNARNASREAAEAEEVYTAYEAIFNPLEPAQVKRRDALLVDRDRKQRRAAQLGDGMQKYSADAAAILRDPNTPTDIKQQILRETIDRIDIGPKTAGPKSDRIAIHWVKDE